MSNPYRPSYRGIAFAATLIFLAVAALGLWLVARHDPVMAELRLAADREHVQSTIALPARSEGPDETEIAQEAGEPAESTVVEGSEEPEGVDTAGEQGSLGSPPLPPGGASTGSELSAGDLSEGVEAPTSSLPRHLNAEPFVGPADVPRIALIINDLGRLAIETEAAIEAPAAVTLSFTPYGRDLEAWINRAREAGHETLIMLPMEPIDYPRDDPGPLALLTTLGVSDNVERLERIMEDAGQSVGIIGQAGSRFLADPSALEPVMAILSDSGFLYIDSNMPDDLVPDVSSSVGLPVVDIDVMVTNTALSGAIDERLLELESIARDRGYAIGLADAYPVFLDRLADWSERLEIRGFALAPITAVADGTITR